VREQSRKRRSRRASARRPTDFPAHLFFALIAPRSAGRNPRTEHWFCFVPHRQFSRAGACLKGAVGSISSPSLVVRAPSPALGVAVGMMRWK
jgi:hypothetical protein